MTHFRRLRIHTVFRMLLCYGAIVLPDQPTKACSVSCFAFPCFVCIPVFRSDPFNASCEYAHIGSCRVSHLPALSVFARVSIIALNRG